MNELTKIIFKELDLKPDEEFYIKELPNEKFKINDKLIVYGNSNTKNLFYKTDILNDILNGFLTIQKIKKPTEDDLAVLKYVKLCGAKYIAQDKDGYIFMYIQRPYKNCTDKSSYLYNKWMNTNQDAQRIHAPISFISWDDDEPTCIDKYI